MAKKKTKSNNVSNILRSYDPYSMEKRIHNLEQNGGSSGGGTWNYSTDEVNTGQKWIDGSDIYSLTIHLDSPISASPGNWYDVSGDYSFIKYLIDGRTIGSGVSSGYYQIVSMTSIAYTSSKIGFRVERNVGVEDIILFYTKD